jgi:hypothetical protein
MTKDRNLTNPGTFGHGVTDPATVAEERDRVAALERLLGPAGVATVGLKYAQVLHDAIVSRRGVLPEFRPE